MGFDWSTINVKLVASANVDQGLNATAAKLQAFTARATGIIEKGLDFAGSGNFGFNAISKTLLDGISSNATMVGTYVGGMLGGPGGAVGGAAVGKLVGFGADLGSKYFGGREEDEQRRQAAAARSLQEYMHLRDQLGGMVHAASLSNDADAFAAIGLSLNQIKSSSPDQVVAKFADGFAGLHGRVNEVAAAIKLFGDDWEHMLGAIERGAARQQAAGPPTNRAADIRADQLEHARTIVRQQEGLAALRQFASGLELQGQLFGKSADEAAQYRLELELVERGLIKNREAAELFAQIDRRIEDNANALAGRGITEATRSPFERFQADMAELTRLHEAGAIDQRVRDRRAGALLRGLDTGNDALPNLTSALAEGSAEAASFVLRQRHGTVTPDAQSVEQRLLEAQRRDQQLQEQIAQDGRDLLELMQQRGGVREIQF